MHDPMQIGMKTRFRLFTFMIQWKEQTHDTDSGYEIRTRAINDCDSTPKRDHGEREKDNMRFFFLNGENYGWENGARVKVIAKISNIVILR